MEKALPNHDLTSTLHLGVRSVADSSPAAFLEKLISESGADEREILQEIIDGNGEKAMVVIHRGPSRGARFLITSEGVTIGRSPSSQIFLDDVTVSRSHATISKQGSGFLFADSGSLNGSYINNQQSASHALTSGDEIQIGKFHMLFIGAKAESGEK